MADASRQSDDLKSWYAWKGARGAAKDEAQTALLGQLHGTIHAAANAYGAAPLPQVLIHLQGTQEALTAIHDFDPSVGQPLNSFVAARVKQRLYRWVTANQNVARVPEETVRMIAPIREAEATLENKLGRPPTTAEVADELHLSVDRIAGMRRTIRRDLVESASDFEDSLETNQDRETAELAYFSFNDQEKQVYDWALGAHGRPKLSTNQIAEKLKVSAARVSTLKSDIADKINAHLGIHYG